MADGSPERPSRTAPVGSWPLTYALVCVLAVLVMAVLYWFAAHFNVRLPRS